MSAIKITDQQLAPWRSLLTRALHLNRSQPYSRYLQLATVRRDGQPANRTVVFRGFLENSNQLQIVTDWRSEKISQIEQQPWGEACWYFTKTREQFRLLGYLTLIGVDSVDTTLQKARQLIWQGLSDAARSQFAWPDPQAEKAKEVLAFSPPPPSPDEPLANFCLLLLDPERVEHLELRGEPQNRCRYYLDSSQQWLAQPINP
jgi:PPOX class probable FMN-dependent enzyme